MRVSGLGLELGLMAWQTAGGRFPAVSYEISTKRFFQSLERAPKKGPSYALPGLDLVSHVSGKALPEGRSKLSTARTVESIIR